MNIYIYLDFICKINEEEEFIINETAFNKVSSIQLNKTLVPTGQPENLIFLIPELNLLKDIFSRYEREDILNNKYIQQIISGYDTIYRYLNNERIKINEENYYISLSFGMKYWLKNLILECENYHNHEIFNNEETAKIYIIGQKYNLPTKRISNISNMINPEATTKPLNKKIIAEKMLNNECSLSHLNSLSKIFCSSCNKEVCIDCHWFSYLGDPKHSKAMQEIEEKLVSTYPKTDNPHLSGHYPYTKVIDRMHGKSNILPIPIYIANKGDNLLKILRVITQGDTGEFVLKQIIPVKDSSQDIEILQEAEEEYKIMDDLKDVCIRSYNYGKNENGFEMLMENWGFPLNRCNFPAFEEKVFYQIMKESSKALYYIQSKGLFHSDIKMENLILNTKCFIPKFIDFGTATIVDNISELFEVNIAINNAKQPMKLLKGLTYHMAPPEVLQYLEQYEDAECTQEISYNLSKIDVFCMGMTFFAVIARERFKPTHLQEMRSLSNEGTIFIREIEEILTESMKFIAWGDEFKLKIIELIKSCLQFNINLRPNSYQLFAIIQYFGNLTLQELVQMLSDINTSQNIKALVDLNELNRQIVEIISTKLEIEKALNLCKEYEGKLESILGEKYEVSEEYLDLCYNYGILYQYRGNYNLSEEWNIKGLNISLANLNPLHPRIESFYYELGQVKRLVGLYNKSEKMFAKALSHNQTIHGNKAHPDIAKCYDAFGWLYRVQGEFNKAENHFNQALEQRIEIYGENPHPDTCASYKNLGNLFDNEGSYEKGREIYKKELDNRILLLGGEKVHPDIALSYMNLGNLNLKEGNYKECEEMYNKCLDQQIKIFGFGAHPTIAATHVNLGNLYHSQGNFTKSEVAFMKALNMQIEIFGDIPHPEIASTYINLGTLYLSQGNYEKSEEMQWKGLELNKKIYGDKLHPEIANRYVSLGACYLAQEKFSKAYEMLEVGFDQQQKIFGKKVHPDMAELYLNLGIYYKNQMNAEKAEEMFIKALDIKKRIFGDKINQEVARCHNALGSFYYGEQEYSKAELNYKIGLNELREIYGNRLHPDIAGSLRNLGAVYNDEGNYERALEMLNEALKQEIEIYGGKGHPSIAICYMNIGMTYEKLGDYTQAEEMQNKALKVNLEIFGGKSNSLVSDNYWYMGNLYHAQSKLEKAEEMHLKALNLRIEVFGSNPHSAISSSLNNLGKIYENQNKLDLSEEMFTRALELNISIYGDKPHPIIAVNYHNLGVLYQKRENIEQAIEMFRKALNQRIEIYRDQPHINLALSYDYLSDMYMLQCNFTAAAELLKNSVDIKIGIYGEEANIELERVCYKLGKSQQLLGNYREAEEAYNMSLNQHIILHGEGPMEATADIYLNLGRCYMSEGNILKSDEMYTIALNEQRIISGSQYEYQYPPNIVDTFNLGIIYLNTGKMEEAIEMFTKEIELLEGSREPQLIASYNNLSTIYITQQNYPKAKEMLNQMLILYKEILGNDEHIEIGNIYTQIAYCDLYERRYSEAEEMFKKGIGVLEKKGNVAYSSIIASYQEIGNIKHNEGLYMEAENIYSKVLALKQELYGEDVTNQELAMGYNNLGVIYYKQEKYNELISLMKEYLEKLIKAHDGDLTHPDVLAYSNNLNNMLNEINQKK